MIIVLFRVLMVAILIYVLGYLIVMLAKEELYDSDWALSRASELHKNQKYDIHPYSYHLGGVDETVKRYWDYYGDDVELRKALHMAALFHDTLEDVPSFTYNDLKEEARKVFSDEFYVNMVAEIVYACTTEKGRNRKERAGKKYYEGIRKTGYAPFIKACDRLSNMLYSYNTGSRMYETYKKELPDFLKHIEEPGNEIPPQLKEDLCQFLQD